MTQAQSNQPILEAKDLVKLYSARQFMRAAPVVRAVDGVDLSVNKGETFAIVGESGCGKSTLARLLLRLVEPTSGQVNFDGRPLTDIPPDEMRRLRARIQFIFQDPFSSLNPRMTVGALIEEPLIVHTELSGPERRQRVSELLEQVGLRPDYANRYPHEFSGGQRQRIGIARALASGPSLLIGDEPVSALDVSIQAQIVNLLEDLKQQLGLTLIIIAHDLAIIRHMSDRVAVMYLGQIVELSPTDQLFDAARHPYTQALLKAIPVPVPGRAPIDPSLSGDIPSAVAPPSGCRFHTRCPFAQQICRQEQPPLDTVGGGHKVACHFKDQIPPAGLASADAATRTEAADGRFDLFRLYSQTA